MIYAVIPLIEAAKSPELKNRISKVDDGAYDEYAPQVYFVSYSGTAKSLADLLGFTTPGKEPVDGVVIKIEDYFGYGNKNLWGWLKERAKA